MITQEEKRQFINELFELVRSNFTSYDLVCYIKNNELAQELLRKCDFCDYEEELDNLLKFDDSTIKTILDTPHIEYYDPEYGSMDPLMSFRVSKAEMDGCNTYDDIRECDNILSHLLDQLEAEPIEMDLKDILNRENLEKLSYGEIDCNASQIYYFEPIGSTSGDFYFAHFYRDSGGWDSNAFKEFNINDFDKIIDTDDYNNSHDTFEALIAHFSNLYREHCIGIPGSIEQEVFNGVEAIARMRDNFEVVFEYVWNRRMKEKYEQLKKDKKNLYSLIEKHSIVKTILGYRDEFVFECDFANAGFDEMWLVRKYCETVNLLAIEIEQREKCIEQYQKQVDKLSKNLQIEQARNKSLKAKEELKKF